MNLEPEIRAAIEQHHIFSAEVWRSFAIGLLAEVDRLRAAALGDGWIPVGERLPEEFIRVLCRLVIGEGRTEGGWAVGSYAAEFGWMTDGIPPQERSHYAITHWQPLPPLPVVEVEE